MRPIVFLLLILVATLPTTAQTQVDYTNFPVDENMRWRVDFWKRVYTEISSTEAFLHDKDDLRIVYEKISYSHLGNRAKRAFVRRKKREIRDTLRRIVKKKRTNLSPNEANLLAVVEHKSDKELLRMARRVRRQQGMRDRYYDGLVRAQPYMEMIRSIMAAEGVPKELAYLPHVESSFNYRAYSKVGAAGMWQFMRGTARRYRLKINYVVDERRDPDLSTHAAAKFLRDNYKRLQAWPLAVTAYNHGPASIARAIKRVGTRDISKIIDQYRARNFGFASKNFYASFMATVEISEDSGKYFPNVQASALPTTLELRLNNRLTAKEIADLSGVTLREFQDLNLALRPSVFRNLIRLPKGLKIRVPVATVGSADDFLAKMKAVKVKPISIPATRMHKVQRGQNLSTIATIYRVPLRDIILLNDIDNPSMLRPGMKLRVPGKGKAWEQERAELYASVEAKTEAESEVESEEDVREADTQSAVPGEDSNESTGTKSEIAMESDADKKPGLFSRIRSWVFGGPKVSSRTTTVAKVDPNDSFDPSSINDGEGEPKIPPFDANNYDLSMKTIRKGIVQIRVEAEETLSHYSDWAKVRSSTVRRMNRIGRRGGIRIGQRLRIPMNDSKRAQFEVARMQFHQAIEEDFYESYRVASWSEYTIKKGDNLIGILQKDSVPLWLLRKRNPDILKRPIFHGQKIRMPEIEPIQAPPPASEQEEDAA